MVFAAPAAVVAAACLVVLIPPVWHAAEIRAIARAEVHALRPGEYVGFYDKGDPRYDETNQLEWYGAAVPVILVAQADLDNELRAGKLRAYVIDRTTYRDRFESMPHEVIAESGHLIGVLLKPR